MPERAHLVHNAAESPDITELVVWPFFTNFRRQVIWCSHKSVRETRVAQDPSDAQISQTYIIAGLQEHVQSLDVTVQYPVLMQPLQPKANLQRILPNSSLLQAVVLSLQELPKVPFLAIFHQNVQGISFQERTQIAHDVAAAMRYFAQQVHLFVCFFASFALHVVQLYLLANTGQAICFPPNFEHGTKASAAKLWPEFEVAL
mmetsp:Transcript_20581/g.47983  ORF Transcript_20581/g.47983 Transcript_20581/m.47983 type:complete len:202 (-) Transcript_20581:51-656(-)